MKTLLIVFLVIFSYIVLWIITSLLHTALFGYVEVGDDEHFSSVFIGSLCPITFPVLLIIGIGGAIFSAIDSILEYIVKKFNENELEDNN